jgi:hypothetical protein
MLRQPNGGIEPLLMSMKTLTTANLSGLVDYLVPCVNGSALFVVTNDS